MKWVLEVRECACLCGATFAVIEGSPSRWMSVTHKPNYRFDPDPKELAKVKRQSNEYYHPLGWCDVRDKK